MIETATSSEAARAEQAKPAARDDIAPGFSFSAAMIALEGRASASLETFGAAPGAGAPGQQGRTQSKSQADAGNAPSKPVINEAATAERRTTSVDNTQRAANTPFDEKSTPSAPASLQPPSASLIAAAPLAAIPAQPPAIARVEAAAMRETALAKTTASKAPRPVARPQAPATTENFAHFLAKKLDSGATSFELRLDPPQLGRVEAHMTIGDDGDAFVSLQFENQNALDHFSRDEAGLRTALSASGYDLDQQKLVFLLRDKFEDASPDGIAATTTAALYEPAFAAPFSTGAVDLRL